jgi:hypothetical protein
MSPEDAALLALWPDVQEVNEGQWSLVWAGEIKGPYPSAAAAVADVPDVLLCDPCWELVTGLLSECQDDCNLSLSHEGVCAPYGTDGPTRCQRCGNEDRLTATGSDVVGDYLLRVGARS